MYRRYLDLIIITTLVLVTLILTLVGVNTPWVMFWIGLPVVFFAPGYALMHLLTDVSMGKAERLLFSLSLSFLVTILGGLLLNLTPWGLRSESWILWLGGIAVLASTAAAFRRAKRYANSTGSDASGWPQIRINWSQTLYLSAAVIVLVGAILISRTGATVFYDEDSFTQLWALPAAGPNSVGTPTSIQLGISNQENLTMNYRVQVEIAGTTVKEWASLELASGKEWEATADLPTGTAATGRVVVNLYRLDAPDKIYHQVFLPLGQTAAQVGQP